MEVYSRCACMMIYCIRVRKAVKSRSVGVCRSVLFSCPVPSRPHPRPLSLQLLNTPTAHAAHSAQYMQIWDMETFQCLRTLMSHSEDILALSSVGSVVFSGSADGTIKVKTFPCAAMMGQGSG